MISNAIGQLSAQFRARSAQKNTKKAKVEDPAQEGECGPSLVIRLWRKWSQNTDTGRHQEIEEASNAEAAPTVPPLFWQLAPDQARRGLVASTASTVFASSALFMPVAGVACIPLMLYAGMPLARKSVAGLRRGRLDVSLLDVTVSGVSLLQGFYLVGSLSLSLYYANRMLMGRGNTPLHNATRLPASNGSADAPVDASEEQIVISSGESVPWQGRIVSGHGLVERAAPWAGTVVIGPDGTGGRLGQVYTHDLILAGQLTIQRDLTGETGQEIMADRLRKAAAADLAPTIFETNWNLVTSGLLAGGAVAGLLHGPWSALAVLSSRLGSDAQESRAALQTSLVLQALQKGIVLLDLTALTVLARNDVAVLNLVDPEPGDLRAAVHQLRTHNVQDIYLILHRSGQKLEWLGKRLGIKVLAEHAPGFGQDLTQQLQAQGHRVLYVYDAGSASSGPLTADYIIGLGDVPAGSAVNVHAVLPEGKLEQIDLLYGLGVRLRRKTKASNLWTTLPGLVSLTGAYTIGLGFAGSVLINHAGTMLANIQNVEPEQFRKLTTSLASLANANSSNANN